MARPPRSEASWERLAAGTRRRWVGAFGGPRASSPDRRQERARFAYLQGEALPVEHTGHGPEVVSTFSQIATTVGVAELRTSDRAEARRIAEFARDCEELLGAYRDGHDFDEAAKAFERRWRRRVHRAAGITFETNPLAVVAMLTEIGPAAEPFYARRVARRRSR